MYVPCRSAFSDRLLGTLRDCVSQQSAASCRDRKAAKDP
jgi:hypothetical protein